MRFIWIEPKHSCVQRNIDYIVYFIRCALYPLLYACVYEVKKLVRITLLLRKRAAKMCLHQYRSFAFEHSVYARSMYTVDELFCS